MAEITLKSPIKLVTSGNVPNTDNLSQGEIAVGYSVSNEELYRDKGRIFFNIDGQILDPIKDCIDLSYNVQSNTLNAIDSRIGAAGGIASLDSTGKVPSSQLPSYVDDVLEFTNKTQFPQSGEAGKIYVDLETNSCYRWGGSTYIEISSPLTIGVTAGTAFDGAKGKEAATNALGAIKTVDYKLGTGLQFFNGDASSPNTNPAVTIKIPNAKYVEGGTSTEGILNGTQVDLLYNSISSIEKDKATVSYGDTFNVGYYLITNKNSKQYFTISIPSATADSYENGVTYLGKAGVMSAKDKTKLDYIDVDAIVTNVKLVCETI